jgi:CRP-like cAMP-binding protein
MTIVSELQQNRLFKGVEQADLEALEKLMTQKSFTKDAVLFAKGDPGDAMFIILSGHVRIYIEDAQHNQITFRVYGPGEVFGEFAILDQQPRSAAAAADEPLEVLILHRDSFLTFLKERPVVGLGMMRSLAERIRYTTLYLERVIDWTESLSKGEYEQAIKEIALSTSDDQIQNLIKTFVEMIHTVEQREQRLKSQAQPQSNPETKLPDES